MTGDWVKIRSDHEYIGRPLAFSCQGKTYEVKELLVQNRTTNGYDFQVRTNENEIFVLKYDIDTDQWSVHQP